MAYFPIFTQIDGKRCLIAGGGKVAARKVYTLLQYGADVVVMAEKVCGEIKEVLPEENVFEGVFKYIHKNRCNKIYYYSLICDKKPNREENHHIAELCHAYNVLVNVADSEEESSFIFPSVVRKGDISIGINSGTGSPTVSKHIRKQIEKAVPDYYADIAVFMGKLREYVKANFKEESQRRYILKTAAAEAFAEERVLTQKEIEEIIRQGQK